MPVTIRPASQDTEQLPRVVGGRDAAPAEWQAWEEEPGHDLVATDGSRAVGGIHVSIVGRTEAWLENLRVHPEFQGQGIAGRLVKEAEQTARHFGVATVRTAIPAHDYGAQAVAERSGYRRAVQCVVVETPMPPGPIHIPYDAPADFPPPERAVEVLRFIERTPTLLAWENLLPLGWRFRRIMVELVRGLIKDRRVVLALRPDFARPGAGRVAQAGELQGAGLFASRDDAVVVSFLEGSPQGLQAAYGAVLEQARGGGAERVVVFAPDLRTLAPLEVREWTPHPWCPDGLIVVEKSLAS